MKIITIFREAIQSEFRLKMDWKGMLNQAKGKAVEPDTGQYPRAESEFRLGYRNMRITAIAAMAVCVISLFLTPFSNTPGELIVRVLTFLLVGLLYFRYSIQLWICRREWEKPGSDLLVSTTRMVDYWNDVGIRVKEVLPIKLPERGVE